ncbi:MAG: hypothetical protein Q8Q56_02115, partial [Alphaproteobacteria bacterium]|nr:hypothetical protein [Alphaproteobacteria bacterium]
QGRSCHLRKGVIMDDARRLTSLRTMVCLGLLLQGSSLSFGAGLEEQLSEREASSEGLQAYAVFGKGRIARAQEGWSLRRIAKAIGTAALYASGPALSGTQQAMGAFGGQSGSAIAPFLVGTTVLTLPSYVGGEHLSWEEVQETLAPPAYGEDQATREETTTFDATSPREEPSTDPMQRGEDGLTYIDPNTMIRQTAAPAPALRGTLPPTAPATVAINDRGELECSLPVTHSSTEGTVLLEVGAITEVDVQKIKNFLLTSRVALSEQHPTCQLYQYYSSVHAADASTAVEKLVEELSSEAKAEWSALNRSGGQSVGLPAKRSRTESGNGAAPAVSTLAASPAAAAQGGAAAVVSDSSIREDRADAAAAAPPPTQVASSGAAAARPTDDLTPEASAAMVKVLEETERRLNSFLVSPKAALKVGGIPIMKFSTEHVLFLNAHDFSLHAAYKELRDPSADRRGDALLADVCTILNNVENCRQIPNAFVSNQNRPTMFFAGRNYYKPTNFFADLRGKYPEITSIEEQIRFLRGKLGLSSYKTPFLYHYQHAETMFAGYLYRLAVERKLPIAVPCNAGALIIIKIISLPFAICIDCQPILKNMDKIFFDADKGNLCPDQPKPKIMVIAWAASDYPGAKLKTLHQLNKESIEDLSRLASGTFIHIDPR